MDNRDISQTPASSIFFQVAPGRLNFWPIVRFWERIVAATLFVIFLPVLMLAALVIVVLSKRAPFIAHQRVNENGGEIWVIKLRTMWDRQCVIDRSYKLVERISETPTRLKTERDPRVGNAFAGFLRRHSIDELPQLWQVACGQLALVGPRPITSDEVSNYYGADAHILLSHKPGITGLWQVCGRSRLNYSQRRRLDLFMIRKWSVPLYLLILARTTFRAPLGKDAW